MQAFSKGSSGFRPPITSAPPSPTPTPTYYSTRTSKRPKPPMETPSPSGTTTGGHPIYGNLNPVTVIRSVFKAKKKQQQRQNNRVYEGEMSQGEVAWNVHDLRNLSH